MKIKCLNNWGPEVTCDMLNLTARSGPNLKYSYVHKKSDRSASLGLVPKPNLGRKSCSAQGIMPANARNLHACTNIPIPVSALSLSLSHIS